MLKKTMLFALAALATMAFAVPAVASASPGAIYDNTTEATLEEGGEVPFSGSFTWQMNTSGGGKTCQIDGFIFRQGSNPADVWVRLELAEYNGCTANGALEGCTAEAGETEASGTVTADGIDLEWVEWLQENNDTCGQAVGVAGCLRYETLVFPELHLQPAENSGNSLDSVSMSGDGTVMTSIGNAPIHLNGTIDATDQGRWSIVSFP